MPQQLFLFDAEENKEEKTNLIDGENKELPVAEEVVFQEEIEVEEPTQMPANNLETIEDPFAEVQRQQQDKVDYLLLMPNKKRGRKSFKDMDEESILIDVPEDDVLYQKQYYPTKIVAEWFGITQSQLRAWENEFDILQPKKNRKGDRFFRPEDIKNLKLIYHLIRRRKFTLQGAKQYLNDNKKNLQATMQLTESLQKFKQFLLELKAISG